METLTQAFPKHKSSRAIGKVHLSQHQQVDAWIHGLQAQIKRLHRQAAQVQAGLKSCNNHIQQMYGTSDIALAGRRRYDQKLVGGAPGWVMRIFFGDHTPELRALALRTIGNVWELITATSEADRVVTLLSTQHNKMLVVELSRRSKLVMSQEIEERGGDGKIQHSVA